LRRSLARFLRTGDLLLLERKTAVGKPRSGLSLRPTLRFERFARGLLP
jgi:hypothetical protein